MENKKGTRRLERIVLFIVIAIVVYMILKGAGFNIIERTEEGGFIDRNGTGYIQPIESKNIANSYNLLEPSKVSFRRIYC